jgi:bifunctional non-homologous end joining protein LigD
VRTVLFRVPKPARSRRRPPAGFITPTSLTLSQRAPTGPLWIHEVKHDGWRIVARRQDGRVRLWTRQANEVTERFSRIAAAVLVLPGGDLVLDGEACCQRDGRNHFECLLSSSGARSAHLVAFDVLEIDGEEVRRKPLAERRLLLRDVVEGHEDLIFSEALDRDGPAVFRHACSLGLEGIVSKRIDKPYSGKRCPWWVKTKNPGYTR